VDRGSKPHRSDLDLPRETIPHGDREGAMKDVLSRGKRSAFQKHKVLSGLATLLVAALNVFAPDGAVADEGGVGFWLTGQFGSMAAVPQVPGWAIGIINY
jgi:hypothetical protein